MQQPASRKGSDRVLNMEGFRGASWKRSQARRYRWYKALALDRGCMNALSRDWSKDFTRPLRLKVPLKGHQTTDQVTSRMERGGSTQKTLGARLEGAGLWSPEGLESALGGHNKRHHAIRGT